MFRSTVVEIHLATLKNNLRLLRQWNGEGAFFCPMVKANAYGHGDVLVARIVEEVGASAMGVALVEEGLRLREAGIRMPILSFAPLNEAAARALLAHALTPVVGSFEDLFALVKVSGGASVGIHLKFNTGMNRLGFDRMDLESLKEALKRHAHLRVEGVCTHLTHGDEIHKADSFSQRQLREFEVMARDFPGQRHAHKSASLATLARHGLVKDPNVGARPGISIYGIPHDADLTAPGLRPVLRWVSRVVRVHEVERGEAVSYGARWVAARRSVIGVVPVGYGDGYMRALSNRGEMLYRGRRVPVVGSVCMDYTLIDLTEYCHIERARPGEEVVLLGHQGSEHLPAVELAQKAGTIAYEIVTGIGQRVAREAVYDSGMERQ